MDRSRSEASLAEMAMRALMEKLPAAFAPFVAAVAIVSAGR
jgi:hypothetical protein